jgi:hypothetical protein
VAKTDRNSVFLDCETHISDRLYKIDMYIIFMDFKKIQISASNLHVLTFGFIIKQQFVAKTD